MPLRRHARPSGQASEASHDTDRFDARVGVVKSTIALGGLFLDRQPHPAAYRRLQQGDGDLDGARRLLREVAEEERRRRRWQASCSCAPSQAMAAVNRFQPLRLSLGELLLEGENAWLVAPERVGVVLRY